MRYEIPLPLRQEHEQLHDELRRVTQAKGEVGGVVANCKLEPEADAMLHLVIAGLAEGADNMAGKNVKVRPALGLVKVAQALNQYGSHFDHPGFKPIPGVH